MSWNDDLDIIVVGLYSDDHKASGWAWSDSRGNSGGRHEGNQVSSQQAVRNGVKETIEKHKGNRGFTIWVNDLAAVSHDKSIVQLAEDREIQLRPAKEIPRELQGRFFSTKQTAKSKANNTASAGEQLQSDSNTVSPVNPAGVMNVVVYAKDLGVGTNSTSIGWAWADHQTCQFGGAHFNGESGGDRSLAMLNAILMALRDNGHRNARLCISMDLPSVEAINAMRDNRWDHVPKKYQEYQDVLDAIVQESHSLSVSFQEINDETDQDMVMTAALYGERECQRYASSAENVAPRGIAPETADTMYSIGIEGLGDVQTAQTDSRGVPSVLGDRLSRYDNNTLLEQTLRIPALTLHDGQEWFEAIVDWVAPADRRLVSPAPELAPAPAPPVPEPPVAPAPVAPAPAPQQMPAETGSLPTAESLRAAAAAVRGLATMIPARTEPGYPLEITQAFWLLQSAAECYERAAQEIAGRAQ